MATRSIRDIAIEMSRIAKRRPDVNRLYGKKLIAYKRLEIELTEAKIAEYGEGGYSSILESLRAELATLEAK